MHRYVTNSIEVPGGMVALLQPEESADLPDDGPVEWAPAAPYWSVLWRSGVALAREVAAHDLRGTRVAELGCGLGAPSIAAATAGASVLATDESSEALELVSRSAALNGVSVETAAAGWLDPGELLARAPFDLVLAADVLYDRAAAEPVLALLPRLAPEAWIADPGRPAAQPFLERARRRWRVETEARGMIGLHRVRVGQAVAHE